MGHPPPPPKTITDLTPMCVLFCSQAMISARTRLPMPTSMAACKGRRPYSDTLMGCFAYGIIWLWGISRQRRMGQGAPAPTRPRTRRPQSLARESARDAAQQTPAAPRAAPRAPRPGAGNAPRCAAATPLHHGHDVSTLFATPESSSVLYCCAVLGQPGVIHGCITPGYSGRLHGSRPLREVDPEWTTRECRPIIPARTHESSSVWQVRRVPLLLLTQAT